MISVQQAFRLSPGMSAAISGAGGKTTTLFALARSLPGKVFLTTTTHIGAWQASAADRHIVVEAESDITAVLAGEPARIVLLTGPLGKDQRLSALPPGALDALRELALQAGATLLVECDGARQRSLKAPAQHEPVIPSWVDVGIVVASMQGVGQPLAEETVHRPEQFARLAGLEMGAIIDAGALARVLADHQGGQKGIPAGARRIALLNGADTPEQRATALRIANLLRGAYDTVLITSMREDLVHAVLEPAAGIILAAGGASRFGEPKILLPWQGRPLLRHAAQTALEAQLDPVVVVLGAVDVPARAALEGLPVLVVRNDDWQAGQSTSLRAGLAALPRQSGSVVFLLADQPFVTPALLRALVERRQGTLAPVIAPLVDGQRANPVLFGRETFDALSSITGDQGGRAVFRQFSPTYLEWLDSNLLRDIDTPEDYHRLQDGGAGR